MGSVIRYERRILALDDTELEQFVREWVGKKKSVYHEVALFAGPGDLGRDVVGFLSPARHDGDWHNYQCKQYGKSLPTADGLKEIGKVLYYAHKGEFTAPTGIFLVAPRGVNRNLSNLIYKPSAFKATLLAEWDKHCGTKIVDGQTIALDPPLRAFIESFDFARVAHTSLDDILNDPHVTPVLHNWFGTDPGSPPPGQVPPMIEMSELRYIGQLVDAYGDREGTTYSDPSVVLAHPTHGQHLTRQRERFYDADAFKRFYRDNTSADVLDGFESDIYNGIIETYEDSHADSLARADAVLKQAASVHPAGPLATHARVSVKQGVCHHFANDKRLTWRR